MTDDRIFNVKQVLGVVTFENYSKYTLMIYIKPKKPKRKFIAAIMVEPKSFTVFDNHDRDTDIDLTTIVFSLEEPNEIHSI